MKRAPETTDIAFDECFEMQRTVSPVITTQDATVPMSLDETKTAQLTDPTVRKLQSQAPH